jgi:exopolysaccharide biosynthesis predicted pyruvyltransferase EpsI
MTTEAPCRRLPLLPVDKFFPIKKYLADKNIWYFYGIGNTGDKLIRAGEASLFKYFGTTIMDNATRPDLIVWGGGGNLGSYWGGSYKIRQKMFDTAKSLNLPVLIMPQSAPLTDEIFPENTIIFAREPLSQELLPNSILAPDTALAYDGNVDPYSTAIPLFEVGVFLRNDKDSNSSFNKSMSLGDIIHFAKTYEDYFKIASEFHTVITDRLHFGIASLMLGRRTILLPNKYFKNYAIYETWLKALGCLWGIEQMEDYISKTGYNPKLVKGRYENTRNNTIQR